MASSSKSSKSSKASSKIEEVKEFVTAESMSLTDDLLDVAANEDFVKLELKRRVEMSNSLMKAKTEADNGKLCDHVAEMIRSAHGELYHLDKLKDTIKEINETCDGHTYKDD